MAATLVTTTICNRGRVTTLVSPSVSGATYIIENGSQGDTQVQYWGTVFQLTDDVTESRYPYEVRQSIQLYRRAHRLTSVASDATFTAYIQVWIPREYLFAFAIIRAFRY